MEKDKKIECIQKFLNYLYQMKEEAHKEAKEKAYDVKDQKLYTLTNKIIKDLKTLLEHYKGE
ncbi:MAG: hypothetical protein ACFFEN_17475 [Candidatus Thorarchaeota archaeon]